jgi:DNA-binding NarL/FixJ family response regulator
VISVLVVDDHPLTLRGLTSLLSDEPDIEVVGSAESGEAALAKVAELAPDVVMMDDGLPGIGGIETCALLRRNHEPVRVVLLLSRPNPASLLRAQTAGATGTVIKRSPPDVLCAAVRSAASGGPLLDPGTTTPVGTARRATGMPHGLTIMEMRVLEKLPQGLSNAEIGRALGIAENTVKTHLRKAMEKLRARDRTQAAAIAIREGLA